MSDSRALDVKITMLEALRAEIVDSIDSQRDVINDLEGALARALEQTRVLQLQRLECHPSRAFTTIRAGEIQTFSVQRDGIAARLASCSANAERHRSALKDARVKFDSLKARQLEVEVETKAIELTLERKRERAAIFERRKLDDREP